MGKMFNYFAVAVGVEVVMIKMLRLLILLAVFLDIPLLILKIILSRKNGALYRVPYYIPPKISETRGGG